MKKTGLAVISTMLFFILSCSSDSFKYYEDVQILKDGTVSLIGEINADSLPKAYHKVYFDGDGKVKKEHYIRTGRTKRSSMYLYENGKITEVRHFEDGKYTGVSKYSYGRDGNIDKEHAYDRDQQFLYSKKF